MVKKFYVLVITIFTFGSLYSQSTFIQKIWAWEIANVGGASIDPSMGIEQTQNIYHLVYLETKSFNKIENITVWCKNGFVYSAKTQKITSFPLKFNGSEVLIKKPKNQLLECVLNKIDVLLTPKKIKNLFEKNEMVIEYTVNKKVYFTTLKTVPKMKQELM
ncbi:MAG: hypothetical protein IPP48_16135 [Chitinophagaceae bacterium]|nr:hypothetical protein [Chitinophagaceae bacterium]